MQIIRNLNQIKSPLLPLALTIGNFDGVHLGHKKIIEETKKIAGEKKLSSGIVTFEPHPVSFFKSEKPRDFRISSFAQKLKFFEKKKIDYVIILPFNQNLAEIKAEIFIEKILVEKLNLKHLVIGYDFIFGKNREGNFQLLERESKNFGFGLSEISAIGIPFPDHDQPCSSSVIRKLIVDGKIAVANKLMGKYFAVEGIVNEGKKLARQLGFPTINIKTKPHIIKPKFGVYKSQVFIPSLNQTFAAVTNFGIKPTIDDLKIPIFESHIFNFDQNLYGKKVRIELIDFIREEKKFASLDELREQIKKDVFSHSNLDPTTSAG
jgi:riboflavin kinase/FMN adenylyltransferase